jgi:predicted dehydrogenase
MLNRKLNVAIWGKSFISSRVAEDVMKSGKVNLVALAGREKTGNDKAQQESLAFAQKYNMTKVYGLIELCNDKDIDLVYIASPNVAHAELSIALMKAGKHVIVEKPMATTQKEVQEILKTSVETQKFCMEALMYQCHPATQFLLNLSEKHLGKVSKITARYGSNIFTRENPLQGGAIRNMGCYPLSLVRLLAKTEPEKMTNCTGVMDDKSERDTSAKTTLEFKNGLTADIQTSSLEKFFELTIEDEHGNKLVAKTNPWMQGKKSTFELISPTGQSSLMTCDAEEELYAYEFEVAINHIERGIISPTQPGVTWEHSLGNAAIIEQWFKQVKQQHDLVQTQAFAVQSTEKPTVPSGVMTQSIFKQEVATSTQGSLDLQQSASKRQKHD